MDTIEAEVEQKGRSYQATKFWFNRELVYESGMGEDPLHRLIVSTEG